jgi:hypothetical protein
MSAACPNNQFKMCQQSVFGVAHSGLLQSFWAVCPEPQEVFLNFILCKEQVLLTIIQIFELLKLPQLPIGQMLLCFTDLDFISC